MSAGGVAYQMMTNPMQPQPLRAVHCRSTGLVGASSVHRQAQVQSLHASAFPQGSHPQPQAPSFSSVQQHPVTRGVPFQPQQLHPQNVPQQQTAGWRSSAASNAVPSIQPVAVTATNVEPRPASAAIPLVPQQPTIAHAISAAAAFVEAQPYEQHQQPPQQLVQRQQQQQQQQPQALSGVDASASSGYVSSSAVATTVSQGPVVADPVGMATPAEAQTAAAEPVQVESRKVVMQVCPTCGERFETLEQVRAHWLEVHGSTTAATSTSASSPTEASSPATGADEAASTSSPSAAGGSPVCATAVPVTATVSKASCAVLASDDQGQPAILQHTDPETGVSRTLVMNKDGSQRIFGESTITSLVSKEEDEVKGWLEPMDTMQMRGLVFEFKTRMIHLSEKYFAKRADLEQRSEQANYKYFGLSPEEGTEKDLDLAYRRLARTMHPDKNGGTEEAKQRFQDMRTRYEELKERMANAPPAGARQAAAASSSAAPPPAEEPDAPSPAKQEDAEDKSERQAEAQDAEGQPGKSDHAAVNEEECDDAEMYPFKASKSALEKEVWKMLQKMKFLEINMKKLDAEVAAFEEVLAQSADERREADAASPADA